MNDHTNKTGADLSDQSIDLLQAKVDGLTAALERQRVLFTRADTERANIARSFYELQQHHLDHHKSDDENGKRAHEMAISMRDMEDERGHYAALLRRISATPVNRPMTISEAMDKLRAIVVESRTALLVRP